MKQHENVAFVLMTSDTDKRTRACLQFTIDWANRLRIDLPRWTKTEKIREKSKGIITYKWIKILLK